MADKCEMCQGMGCYGDQGPGLRDSGEVMPCDCEGAKDKMFDYLLKVYNKYVDIKKQLSVSGTVERIKETNKLTAEVERLKRKLELAMVDSCTQDLEVKRLRDALEEVSFCVVRNSEDKLVATYGAYIAKGILAGMTLDEACQGGDENRAKVIVDSAVKRDGRVLKQALEGK